MKNVWIVAVALIVVLAAAGYTIAQSSGGSQGKMMGPGMEMMGGGMMGQGEMMGSGTMNMMMGQPLSEEQLKQFAEQHGITPDQAKQMTDQCSRIMGTSTAPETPKQ